MSKMNPTHHEISFPTIYSFLGVRFAVLKLSVGGGGRPEPPFILSNFAVLMIFEATAGGGVSRLPSIMLALPNSVSQTNITTYLPESGAKKDSMLNSLHIFSPVLLYCLKNMEGSHLHLH